MAANRKARRRARALARKARRSRPTRALRFAWPAIAPPTLPQWRIALLGSAAFVGVSLSDGPAHAQCAPLTAGADNVTCAGALDGTNSDALAGNDTITVNTTIGTSGAATVSGGADDDSFAFSNDDHIGLNGGSAGQVLGDVGNDTITIDTANVGHSGDGTVDGGAGNDSITISSIGGLTNISGIAYFAGSRGQVLGDIGNDTITLNLTRIGRNGNGTVSGGAGADSISLNDNSQIGNSVGSTGIVQGDADNDTITINNSRVGGNGNGTVSGGANDDLITLSNGSIISFALGSGQVLGDAGNDTITVSAGNVGQYGSATLSGGDGADSIALSANSNVNFYGASGQVLGDAGDDTITLDSSNVGNRAAGTVSGGADNDSIALTNGSTIGTTNYGSGLVAGDAGADTITLDNSRVGYSGSGTVSGGGDADSIVLSNASSIGRYAGSTGQVLGDGGADTITLSQSVVGDSGAGTVSGGADNDSIALGSFLVGFYAGSTGQVLGDAGADTITLDSSDVGRSGAGTVDGGAGNDSIALSSSSDIGSNAGSSGQVQGDAGADTITINNSAVGNRGGATVSGGADGDSIALSNLSYIGSNPTGTGQVLGDAGADTITLDSSTVGAEGAGTVSGGADNDSIALSNRSFVGSYAGSSGLVAGDTGADTITIDNSTIANAGAGTVSGGAGGDSIALSNLSYIGSNPTGTGQVLGDAGNDTITIDNSIVGAEGPGTVSGGDDADSIALTNGAAVGQYAGSTGQVLGDAGADTITLDNSYVGLRSAGTVSGGADNDRIALSNRSTIGRYAGSTGQVLGDAGADTIALGLSVIGSSGAGTVSGGSENDSITLSNGVFIGYASTGTGQVLGDGGTDTIALSQSVVGDDGAGTVSGGSESDSITLSDSFIGFYAGSSGQVLGDVGADTITLSQSVIGNYGGGTVSGGTENDSIALSNSSIIGQNASSTGQVLGDAGADTITLDNSSIGNAGAGTVDGGADDDSIALSNGTIVGALGQVLGSAGNDTVGIDDTVTRAAGSLIDGGTNTDHLAFNANGNATVAAGEILNFEQLRKDGPGTLTANADIGFSDLTIVNAGILDLAGAGAITSATVTINGGELQTDGGGLVPGANIGLNGGVFDVNGNETIAAINNGGMLDIADGTTLTTGTTTNNAGGVITLGVSATLQGTTNTLNNAATINVATNGALVDAGDLNNLATGVINFNGPGGTATLSSAGANGIVNDGDINLNSGNLTIAGNVTNQGAGTFDILSGTATTNGAFTNNATSVLNVTGGGFTGITTLTNNSTAASGINVSAGQTLSAVSIVNNNGATITNAGTLTGTNSIANNAGATLNLNGNLISPTVTNQATITIGGQGQIGTGTITGNFVQTGTGTFAADVDLAAGTADRINVTGSANLAGTVTLRNLTPGTQQVTILSAAGGTTNNGLGLNNIASPLVDAELLFPNATDVALGVTVDFTPAGLNANQTNIANHLSAALGAGGGTLGPVTDVLLNDIANLADYQSALDRLSPEVYLNAETTSLFAAEAFIDNLFSCPVAGGGSVSMAEGQCVWVRPEGRVLDQDGDADTIGFDEDSYGLSVGAQFALAPKWFAGFAFGYENASLNNDRGAESDSERFSGGGVLKYQSGPLRLAAAVSGGTADFETQRGLASSDHDVDYIAGQVRAAYVLDQGEWYAKPMVDLNLTRIDRNGITENGAGAANLTVGGSDDLYFSVTPAIELGADIALDKDTSLQPFIRAGVTVYEDDDHALTARFAGAPAGLDAFVTRSEFDDVVADIEAGLTVFSDERTTLRFSYEGHLGDDTRQHGGMAQVSVKF